MGPVLSADRTDTSLKVALILLLQFLAPQGMGPAHYQARVNWDWLPEGQQSNTPSCQGQSTCLFPLTEELRLSGRRALSCSEDTLFELMA